MQIRKYIKAIKKYTFSKDYRFLINSGYGKYGDMPDAEYLSRKSLAVFRSGSKAVFGRMCHSKLLRPLMKSFNG